MKPDISEFSYGYALTDELIHWHNTAITVAPVFPSLYQEGQVGGGYDLKLDRGGIPFFIQFKLSHFMSRGNAREMRDGTFASPFYRMHLRPRRHSNQHRMLLNLDLAGNEVYYCAPAFHEMSELNDTYLNHQVYQRSVWFLPSAIGALPNDADHHVAFQLPGNAYFCSEPIQIQRPFNFKWFAKRLESRFVQDRSFGLSDDNLTILADKLYNIGNTQLSIQSETISEVSRELFSRKPLERAAYYARLLFDLQMFVATERVEGKQV